MRSGEVRMENHSRLVPRGRSDAEATGPQVSPRIAAVADAQRDQLTPLVVSDTPVEKFREFLEIRGEKLTEPRRVLVRHIFDSHKHFDADELVRDLHDAGHQVSRATVYRTLRL